MLQHHVSAVAQSGQTKTLARVRALLWHLTATVGTRTHL